MAALRIVGLRLGLLVLAALAVLGGCTSDGAPQGASEEREDPVVGVRVAVAESRALEHTLTFTGELVADRRVELAADVAARVTELAVEEGDELEEGALIAQLDDTLARRALAESEAALAGARARKAEAQAALDRARNEVARREPLAARDAFPVAELDRLRDDAAVATSALEVADAEVGRVSAAAASAREAVARHTVRAPLSAAVVARHVTVGAMVSPQAPLVTLIDPTSLRFEVRLPEHALGSVRIGTEASVTLDAVPDRVLPAVVDRVAGTVDRTSRTVRVLLRLDEGPDLREGMFGQGSIVVRRNPDAIVVPTAAVQVTGDGGSRIWVVEGDTVRSAAIEVVMREHESVAVEGITAGAAVVVAPPMGLADGAQVHVVDGRATSEPPDGSAVE